jgi:phosphate starvation-inducible PhoH-like protein
MFLTRLGFGSKMVVTGDVTQVDLPGGTRSGLRVVRDILQGVEDIHFSELSADDVVRHRLVGAIVDAYGTWDEEQQRQHEGRERREKREQRERRERHANEKGSDR